jgi:HD-GYP domain-containing protein (c-di-GMP phosphodiesterase class II)
MEARFARAFEHLADWCALMHAPCWRIDHTHRSSSTSEHPLLHTLAHDPKLQDAIAAAAVSCEDSADPFTVIELAPGAFFIFLRERDKRHSLGWVVTLAPTADSITGLAALLGTNLPHTDLLQALQPALVIDHTQVAARARALAHAHAQALAAIEHESTIDQFTDQLTQAYETACMGLRVSRMMTAFENPAHFVDALVRELHTTSEFGWVTFTRHADPYFRDSNVPDFAAACDPARFDHAQLRAAAHTILAAKGHDTKPTILEAATITSEALGPELIVQPLRAESRTLGLLILGARNGKEWAVNSYDTLLVETTAASLTAYLETVRLHAHQQQSFLGTLRALTASLDAKDPYTRGHSERVALLAQLLARAVKLPPDAERTIHIAGLIHDIGKIGVPESVLTGTTRPTTEEFNKIRQHPTIGHEILKGIPLLADALPGVLHHHERWDGNGYPAKLKGNAIPRIARMLALCDAFDAMSSSRTYDAARARAEVLTEIRNCRGSHFDPELTDAFLTLDFSAYDQLLAQAHAEVDTPSPTETERRSRDRAA